MRSEWKETRVKELGKIITGKTPRTTAVENFGGMIPFLTPSDDMTVKYVRRTSRTLSRKGLAEVSNKILPANSIAVSCIGSDLGKVVMTTEDTVTNQQINSIIPKECYYPDYVYYAMKTLGAKLNFLSKTSTAVPIINKTEFSNETILVPPIQIQKDVADILSCLDAKIELNNKINENLKVQAQSIFKSWFVDFERFKDGPFVESELGLIPEGWHVKPLSEIVASTIAGDWGKAEPEGNHTAKAYCIRGADIPDVKWGNKGNMPTRYILSKNIESKRLQSGNLVVEISGGSPTQSTGRVVKISDYLLGRYDGDMICTNFCRALSVEPPYSTFLYHYWLHMYDLGVMFGYENGTTGIKNFDLPSFLKNTLIALPPNEVLEEYNEAMDVFESRVYSNGLESEVLSTLRDTLLPKLMSGEIEVPID